jgi:phospholipase C
MKKKVLALATTLTLCATMSQGALAQEGDGRSDRVKRWSAEDMHQEGVNTHLWIVNRAIEIMSRDTKMVQPNHMKLLNEWRTEVERGIYTADHENPYYDNYTFASHFYDPDTGSSYIPLAAEAKETGAKYFKLAGEAYQKNDMKQAFFYLGVSLHYLGDVNQPMHAANFTNISYPQGFHSKFENYIDTVKENYKVTDAKGYWNWKGMNPADWIHGSAVEAKKDYAGIVNDTTKNYFVRAAVSQEYADKWRAEVTPTAGKRLMEGQRVIAGYIELWLETYVK